MFDNILAALKRNPKPKIYMEEKAAYKAEQEAKRWEQLRFRRTGSSAKELCNLFCDLGEQISFDILRIGFVIRQIANHPLYPSNKLMGVKKKKRARSESASADCLPVRNY